jgi:isopentenyl-diphosphate delta-isomerase
MHRAKNESQARLAAAFVDWGIPTSEAILNVHRAAPGLMIIASGGLRSGVDIAKCIALGASMGGMAGPFLKAAARSHEATVQTIEELKREIQVCMFAAGAGDVKALQNIQLMRG